MSLFGDLSEHFGSVLDTQIFSDPWGMGIKAEVLRESHPDWKGWRKKNVPDEGGKELQKAMRRATLEQAMKGGGGKQTYKRSGLGAEPDTAAIVERAVELMPESDAPRFGLEDLKPGIASVLLRKMWGLAGSDSPLAAEQHMEALADSSVEIPAGQHYQSMPIGDAIATWILDMSAHAEAFRAGWVEDAAEGLGDTPSGQPATGPELRLANESG